MLEISRSSFCSIRLSNNVVYSAENLYVQILDASKREDSNLLRTS